MGVVLKLFIDSKKETHERAHSPFSASGAERWFNCPGSVKASEGVPRKDSPWSIEGTLAHAVLERALEECIKNKYYSISDIQLLSGQPREMALHAKNAANFILKKWIEAGIDHAELKIESRVSLAHIHPQMFGTLDGAVIDHWGTLHVFDYKYGKSMVSPEENLQMIFYAMAIAYEHHWDFKNVRLWIIQPRANGYDGPSFWELSIKMLKEYEKQFITAIDVVDIFPGGFTEGSWCHWCAGKVNCPLKQQQKAENIFKPIN